MDVDPSFFVSDPAITGVALVGDVLVERNVVANSSCPWFAEGHALRSETRCIAVDPTHASHVVLRDNAYSE